MVKSNDGRTLGIVTCDLDGILDGFGTGGKESSFLGTRAGDQVVDFFCQLNIAGIGYDLVGGMGKVPELLLDGGDQTGVAVPSIEHGDTAGEINITVALDIPEQGVFSLVCEKITKYGDTAWGGGLFTRL